MDHFTKTKKSTEEETNFQKVSWKLEHRFTKLKMESSKLYRLIDLIEEIKKIDDMILMHRNHGKDEFMPSQYEFKKSSLMKELISELAANSSESPEVFNTIGKIIFKFYPNESSKKHSDLDQLVAAIG